MRRTRSTFLLSLISVGSLVLAAPGLAHAGAITVLSDDFDLHKPGSQSLDTSVWSQWDNAWVWDGSVTKMPGATEDYTAWFPDGNALFFQEGSSLSSDQPNRFAETVDVSLTPGGSVSFNLSLGAHEERWDGPFERQETSEYVMLQYSLDGGNDWSLAHEFDLNDAGFTDDNRWSLFEYHFEAGDPVASSSTRFRIAQNNHSGSDFDTWAFDNFEVSAIPSPAAGLAGLAMAGLLGFVRPGRRRERA